MAPLENECQGTPTVNTMVRTKSECTGEESWTAVGELPSWSECEIVKIVTDSSLINGLKSKDAALQKEIDELKNKVWPNGNISKRLSDLESCCEESQERDNATSSQIDEINANITYLKGWNVRQDTAIESLKRNVIIDETHLNFQERLEEVYIPNADALVNKYKQWDIYINVNQDVSATNATYIFIRYPESKEEAGAGDWQEIYYSSPADVLTILWIDPIEVEHPFKHERVIKVNPQELRKMIEELPRLDLSSVELNLWVIYEKPVYKNDVTIEFNLTVNWETYLNNVHVDNLTETKNLKTVNLDVTNITTNNPVFNNNITVRENITAGDTITTNKFYSTGHSYFNDVTFDWPMYINPGPGNPDTKPATINQTIYTPSFARFALQPTNQHSEHAPMEHSWNPWLDVDRTRIIHLWWGGTEELVWWEIRWNPIKWALWLWSKEKRWTPDIEIMKNWMIYINNTWIYDVQFLFNFWQWRNIYANRAWVVAVRLKEDWSFEYSDFIDAKYNSGIENDGKTPNTYVYRWHNTSNDHVYSTWDYTSLDRVDTINEEYAMAYMLWQELSAVPFQWSALFEIPYWEHFALIPYIKPSCAWWNRQPTEKWQSAWVRANVWWRDTWAACTINIHKVANSTTNVQY